MPPRNDRRRVAPGLILFLAALAPAAPPAQQQQPAGPGPAPAVPEELARARAGAAAAAWDLAWLYYSENRVDADTVYRWSRRRREADRDAARDRAGRVAADEAHLARMRDLEAKVAKVRRLGFGTSFEVAGAEYYRREAESWLAEARAR